MEKVSVNKGVLIGVVAVAAVSLLVLAFLLGRASESGSPSGQPSGRELPGGVVASPVSDPRALDQPLPLPTPAAASITDLANTPPAPAPAPSYPEHRAPLQAAPRPAPAPTDGERGSAASDSARAAVAAYFDAVDHIQAGKMSGAAESVANEMAAALAKGDTSGLDRMIQETEAAKESLAALTPPASCAAHHRESLGSLDDALEILRSLKTAMESPEPAAQLTGVATRATALRSRSEVLQKEELALRQRYGLTH
jgi:hypothetical protein